MMKTVYLGGIVIAGGFTFVPGRIMHQVVFGQGAADFAMIFAGAAVLAGLFVTVLLQKRQTALR